MSGTPEDIFRNLGKSWGNEVVAPEEPSGTPEAPGIPCHTKVELAEESVSFAPEEPPQERYQFELPGSPAKILKKRGRSLF